MTLIYIAGIVAVLFLTYCVVIFGYELWKESELRKDLLEKKKQRRGSDEERRGADRAGAAHQQAQE